MEKKGLVRKKLHLKRKKKYFEINKDFFLPLIKLLESNSFKDKKIKIALYYPSSNEVNVLKILDLDYFKKFDFSLPAIEKNSTMNFYKWKNNDILNINKFGILEPEKVNKIIPNFILVPLLAYDSKKNRLGYGKGFYDKYLNKFNKIKRNIMTIGIAFSFQKYQKLPTNNRDYKLDYIITEKGIL